MMDYDSNDADSDERDNCIKAESAKRRVMAIVMLGAGCDTACLMPGVHGKGANSKFMQCLPRDVTLDASCLCQSKTCIANTPLGSNKRHTQSVQNLMQE